MTFILSHQVLDEVLARHRVKPNDLAGIDRLFGGADGYYWYHTMRHLCPRTRLRRAPRACWVGWWTW